MKLYYAKAFITENKNIFLYDALLESLHEIEENFYKIIESDNLSDEQEKFYYNYINEYNIRNIINPPQTEISHGYKTDIIERIINSHKKLLILSITNKCNMNCTYCIYHDKFNNIDEINHTMPFETAVKAIDNLLETSLNLEQAHIGFYGGESLLEFDLIKRCVEYIKSKSSGIKITFGTTTNGILLNNERIRRYFEDNNFQVSVSLDGPKILNDRYRITKLGKGSYATVISNLNLWYKENPDFVKSKVLINIVEAPPVYLKVLDDFFCGFPMYYSYSSFFCTPYFKSHMDVSDDNMKKIVERENSNFSKRFNDEVIRSYKNYLPRNLKFTPEKIIPGGVCMPIYMRWYVNSKGEYYPCERIEEKEEFCIGNVDRDINYEKIVSLFDNYIIKAKDKCNGCWGIKICGRCFKNIEESCDDLLNNLEKRYLYFLEKINGNKYALDKIDAISYII